MTDAVGRPDLRRCEAGSGGCDGRNLASFVVENINHEPKYACSGDIKYFLDVTVMNTVTPLATYQQQAGIEQGRS